MVTQYQRNKVLADFISDLKRRKSPSTVASYSCFARRFLEYTTGDYSRRKLLSFIDEVSAGNKSYYRWAYYVCRRLYKSMDIKFPLDVDDLLPVPADSEMVRPVMGIDDVARMIHFTKVKGSPPERAYLALSTTYGFRLGELRMFTSEKIIDGVITVDTEKHGERRTHTVPAEIEKQLHFAFRQRSQSAMSEMFNNLCVKAGVQRVSREGYHSIRRSLDTQLILNGVSLLVVKRWMGWKIGSLERVAFGMPGRYFNVSTQELDKIVFESHPFLPFWGDGKPLRRRVR